MGTSMPAKQRSAGHTPPPEWLVARVREEFAEVPGLRLTLVQACRLWQLDMATCESILEHFVRDGFLRRTDSGFYVASQETRSRT